MNDAPDVMKSCIRLFLVLLIMASVEPARGQFLGPGDFDYPEIEEERRIAYGADALQWGVLRVPDGPGPHPVIVMMHGGCWMGLHRPRNVEPLMAALTERGWATWSLSHRQATDTGGGWTGTFEDVGAGIDFVRRLAEDHALDTKRVVTMGHSAGGHLALWAAGRTGYESSDQLYAADALPLAGAISLDGIPDLRAHAAQAENPCGDGVFQLLDHERPGLEERYDEASSAERLPLGVPQLLLHGRADYVVPWQQITAYADAAQRAGDDVQVHIFEAASHFEVIAPASNTWRDEIAPVLFGWLNALPALADE